MRLLLIDNFDSFTFNVVHLFRSLGVTDIHVRRNDRVSKEEVLQADAIILSPGPGIPNEAGRMPEIVRQELKKPMLGVCLGHQCIGEQFGGTLRNLERPVHGHALPMEILDVGDPLFNHLPNRVLVGRYHSWVVERDSLPSHLKVTAIDERGEVMALRHQHLPLWGVQFHPESILTEHGEQIAKNFLTIIDGGGI